jgi:hypothetical protein
MSMTASASTVLLRIYTKVIAALYAYTGLTQSHTMVYQVAHADPVGIWGMYALAIFAVVGAVDLIVNDIMPARYVLEEALNYRHFVSMGIAGGFAVEMWVCVKFSMPLSILPFYAIYVVMIPAAALADVHQRYKPRVCT